MRPPLPLEAVIPKMRAVTGMLDKRGDGMVQFDIALIALIFNKHRWCCGAGPLTEDAMHFEINRELLESLIGDLK